MSSPLDYIACVSGEHHGHALTALLAQGDPPTKTGLWCETCGRYLKKAEAV